jgi:hypothetical protein
MDKYAIMCLFILVILSIWHAIIGYLIFVYIPDFRVTPMTWFVYLDRYVFYSSILIYIIIHIVLIIWLFSVPLKYRRELKQKDISYRQLISKESQVTKKKLQNKSDYTPISMCS